jgi:hypothetical protein
MLFFGRRRQTVDMLERLHWGRFLAVVGSSGCGKSSLVRAGLIPSLKAGFLVEERDHWRDIVLTPGEKPFRRLADAFQVSEVELREGGLQVLVDGLHRKPNAETFNCLLMVDQFEELFRFREGGAIGDDSSDFVNLCLALASQRGYPVFVVFTMRSDFLGDCDAFHGLPEAFNRGLYQVPRLTRQQRREAIEGPLLLFDTPATAELVDRVLNDVGDEPDQLPVMEHALMRTWENWRASGSSGPIGLEQYLAIGGAKEALSLDAESALQGMNPEQVALTIQLFQALTDTDPGNRRVRRPVLLSEFEKVSGRPRVQILEVIRPFRESGRSFLVVQGGDESADAVIDISHESLIRQWKTLRSWVDAEAESKRIYLDLVNAVERRKALIHDSDLQMALDWREHASEGGLGAPLRSPVRRGDGLSRRKPG